MTDEKDRLGDKLRKKEKAEEDRYFGERDRAALEKLRRQQQEGRATVPDVEARGRCPVCGERLVSVRQHGVTVEECPAGHGMWISQGEMQTLAQRERDSWLGRYFYRPKPAV